MTNYTPKSQRPRQPESQLEKAVKIIDKRLRLNLPPNIRTATGARSGVTWKMSNGIRVYSITIHESILDDEMLTITELITQSTEIWQKIHGHPPKKNKRRIYNSELIRQLERSGVVENTDTNFPHRFRVADETNTDASKAANEIIEKGILRNIYSGTRREKNTVEAAYYRCPGCLHEMPVLNNSKWIHLLDSGTSELRCTRCNRAYERYDPYDDPL